MTAEVILDNEYATLWYHPDSGIVHHKFHKFIYGEKFREVLNTGYEVFKARGASKWLTDDRLNSAIPKEDTAWLITDWNPRVIAAEWKYWAAVLPDKKVGQVNINWLMRGGHQQGLIALAFEDPDETLHWLETVDQTAPVEPTTSREQ